MKVLLKILLASLFITSVHAIEATHGMVLFGQQKIMAYHLPMFHQIHARQVILELSMNETMRSIISNLQHDSGLVTFVPDPFDLELFLQKPHSLKGDLYKGHFEKDGEVLLTGITLEVEKVLYNQPIKKQPATRPNDNYVLVGSTEELYAVHLLDGNYHQDLIAKVKHFADERELHFIRSAIMTKQTFKFSQSIIEENNELEYIFHYEGHCRLESCPRTAIIKGEVEKIIFTDHVM